MDFPANGAVMTTSMATANQPFAATGQGVGWAAVERAVRDFDDQLVQDCKEDIDTLLTFVSKHRLDLVSICELYSLHYFSHRPVSSQLQSRVYWHCLMVFYRKTR